VISAQAEGIPVLYSATSHFPLFRGDVFRRIIVICDPYIGPPRLAIDRFDVRQFIWENALNTIELVSFLDAESEPVLIVRLHGIRLVDTITATDESSPPSGFVA